MNDGRKITIDDIAKDLGVSKTTVSRAISGKGRVGGPTRERILQYISEHNYVPSAMAKGLAQSKTYNIGLSIPEDFALVDLPFFQKCLMGICEYAGSADYDVIISMTSKDDISQLERMVSNRKVDGVILTRTLTNDPPAEYLKQKNIPFVTIGSTSDKNIIQVDNDHEAACCGLTSILLRKHIGKVVLLCGDPNHVVTQSRLNGFKKALANFGVKETDDNIRYDTKDTSFDEVIEDIVAKKFDCILCMDDSLCVRVLDKLKKDNINVPKDIKVASFYNSSVIERNVPAITTLKFDANELGQTACKTLLNIIDGKPVPPRTLLGYEISMQESTKID